MTDNEMVLAKEFCTYYSINIRFIESLGELGLIELVSVGHEPYIHHNQLQRLEQLLRLHSDLDINIEGIDVVFNLLDKMNAMTHEITSLRNRLKMYED